MCYPCVSCASCLKMNYQFVPHPSIWPPTLKKIDEWGGVEKIGPEIWPDMKPQEAVLLLEDVLNDPEHCHWDRILDEKGRTRMTLARWDFTGYYIRRCLREAMQASES